MTKAVPKAYMCGRVSDDGSKIVETVGHIYSRKSYCQKRCDELNRTHKWVTGFHFVVFVADNWQLANQ